MPFSLGRHLRVGEATAQPYPLDATPVRPIALVPLQTGCTSRPLAKLEDRDEAGDALAVLASHLDRGLVLGFNDRT